MRIAVIGSGISGMIAARMLHDAGRAVTLYEAAPRLGGHAYTVEVPFGEDRQPVDVGYIVYNDRNYPNLTRLFETLEVATQPSDMSFSASIDGGVLEYAGSKGGLFAQRRNLLRPRFWRMVFDILRFFRIAKATAQDEHETRSLGAWLSDHGFSRTFIDDHLLPMAAAIWSCPCATMLDFPVRSFLKFYDNHGLLELRNRPRWRTVTGGSRAYVAKLMGPLMDRVRLGTPITAVRRTETGVALAHGPDGAEEHHDAVIFACHAPQADALLADADPDEAAIIGTFRTQQNTAILHSDPALMPKRRKAWAAWNYVADARAGDRRVALTYWMNILQGIAQERPLFVSLNPLTAPMAEHARFSFAHPVFDHAAIAAQAQLSTIQGRNRIWWCGAWTGYGFHEDGMRSGMAAAHALGGVTPWERAARDGATGAPERAAAAPAR